MLHRFLILILLTLSLFGVNFSQNPIGDGAKASEAILEFPSGIAVDQDNNVYIAERRANRIRKVDGKTGIITTFAGTGIRGFSGDGGKATEAQISIPELIAFDKFGNLYIADRGNGRIRKVDGTNGIISTIAGSGETGFDGDGGLARNAKISSPYCVAFDKNGDLFFADTENHSIRKIDMKSGKISTVAGNGIAGFSGDGGPATGAQLRRPHNFAFDADGDLIIGDSFNNRIRKVDHTTEKISTLYGIGETGFTEDGENASNAKFGFFGSFLITDKHIIFSEWINKRIRLIDKSSGIMTSLADPDGRPFEIEGPYGMAFDSEGNLYVAEAEENRVLKIDMKTRKLIRFAGK
ncbi:MAG: hypothetical protein R2681_08955 [Pyrinomonadaceae bacterium]